MRTLALLLVLTVVTPRASDGLDVVWNFDGSTPFTATTGAGSIAYYDPGGTGWGPAATQFGTNASFGLPALPVSGGGGAGGNVWRVPATTPTQGYRVDAGSPAGSYTLVWDYLSPTASDGRWRSLLQTSLANNNDGEFFVRNQPSGGIGINGVYHGSIAPNTWNRIAMTRDTSGTMRKYVNGVLVGSQPATDARFNLDSSFYLFTDEDNETSLGYLSSFRLVDAELSPEDVRLLGNVSSAGAATPGPVVPTAAPPIPLPLPPLMGRTMVMGHRGGGFLAPENTLAAIRKGFEVGADLIEIDIHLTADGHAVVFHDSTLDRTTDGMGPIAALTLAQVKALDAGSWFGAEYTGERVPTLTEALTLIGGRGRTILDVKVPASPALRNAINNALVASGTPLDEVWVWPQSSAYSGDSRFGSAQVQLLNSVPSDLSDANLQSIKSGGIAGLSVPDGQLTQEIVNAFHRNGMWVDAYTVNDTARMKQLIAMGVDSIETDRPDLMAPLVWVGDYNADGVVNAADYTVYRDTLGATGAGMAADADGNGRVELRDYGVWAMRYGQPGRPGGSSSIPEPAALVGAFVLAATFHRRRIAR
ncbi:MAG: glycerophosphodiester phosphodiesterase family protein [Lacipirellulaceae bacterium]